MKKILVSAVLLAASAGFFVSAAESPRKAPEFSFSVPGKGPQLLSQYVGKVVALEFIFTTCPHCQAASHYMTQLQSKYADRGLQVIDIAVNPNADLLVENFVKEFQVNFPVGWATSDQMTTFMGFPPQRYVVPQLVLIDRKGFMHWPTPNSTDDGTWEKLMNQDAVREHIEQLLAQPASASAHAAAGAVKISQAKKPS